MPSGVPLSIPVEQGPNRVTVDAFGSLLDVQSLGYATLTISRVDGATGQPIAKEKFPHQIVNNLFSHNTTVAENGYNGVSIEDLGAAAGVEQTADLGGVVGTPRRQRAPIGRPARVKG